MLLLMPRCQPRVPVFRLLAECWTATPATPAENREESADHQNPEQRKEEEEREERNESVVPSILDDERFPVFSRNHTRDLGVCAPIDIAPEAEDGECGDDRQGDARDDEKSSIHRASNLCRSRTGLVLPMVEAQCEDDMERLGEECETRTPIDVRAR